MSGTCVSGGATVRKGASRTKQVLRACATLLIVFGLVSVAGAQASPPTVEGFAPTIGYRGAIVRLEGSGFSEVSQVTCLKSLPAGASHCPSALSPQQTTLPSVFTPHVCFGPALTCT